MTVYHGGTGLLDAGSETNPANPGVLDANGGMALSVCVKHVAPARRPASPSSYVAVEWPIETLMPDATRDLINEDELRSSGASVTSLMDDARLWCP
jgi:hypothetical protein